VRACKLLPSRVRCHARGVLDHDDGCVDHLADRDAAEQRHQHDPHADR
jgi:hypothetical protein